MHPRFHAPDAHRAGQTIALPADESAHATRVLRLRIGDTIRVFDGHGHEFFATITGRAKSGVTIRVEEPCAAGPERGIAVTLAQAVLKADKMDNVVRDAVMMGVSAIVPLLSERTEASAAAIQRGQRRARWERIAIVSAKQCGRAVVPPIEAPCTLAALCERLAADPDQRALMFLEPSAAARDNVDDAAAGAPAAATVLVGPEGGWSPDEIANTAAMVSHVTLRGPTLRADAMPIVALTALFASWNEL